MYYFLFLSDIFLHFRFFAKINVIFWKLLQNYWKKLFSLKISLLFIILLAFVDWTSLILVLTVVSVTIHVLVI